VRGQSGCFVVLIARRIRFTSEWRLERLFGQCYGDDDHERIERIDQISRIKNQDQREEHACKYYSMGMIGLMNEGLAHTGSRGRGPRSFLVLGLGVVPSTDLTLIDRRL
jgi:hypothetical protein